MALWEKKDVLLNFFSSNRRDPISKIMANKTVHGNKNKTATLRRRQGGSGVADE